MAQSGAYIRKTTTYHSSISTDLSAEFPVEAGRYHLYVSYGCPWASRCILFRKLKGLEAAIPMHCVSPFMDDVSREGEPQTRGWVFSDEVIGGVQCNDSCNGFRSMRELYETNDKDYVGKYTVPVLWDSKTKKIVNNESSEIIRMFNETFNSVARDPQMNLRPSHLADQIDKLNEWLFETINLGVYKCGFATTQEAYEAAFHPLFAALEEAEEMLSKTRFLIGNDQPLECDFRLFVTLIRFDLVYYSHFKCNKKRIIDYPNLWGYLRDLYQWPDVKDSVNLFHIKHGYHRSMLHINPTGIVPLGPDIDFDSPHGRDKQFA